MAVITRETTRCPACNSDRVDLLEWEFRSGALGLWCRECGFSQDPGEATAEDPVARTRAERDQANAMVDDLAWALELALGGKMAADPRVTKVREDAERYLNKLKET